MQMLTLYSLKRPGLVEYVPARHKLQKPAAAPPESKTHQCKNVPVQSELELASKKIRVLSGVCPFSVKLTAALYFLF
jgi:hypothetical protein